MVWSNQASNSITIPDGATTGSRIVIDSTGIVIYDTHNNVIAAMTPGGASTLHAGDTNPDTAIVLGQQTQFSGLPIGVIAFECIPISAILNNQPNYVLTMNAENGGSSALATANFELIDFAWDILGKAPVYRFPAHNGVSNGIAFQLDRETAAYAAQPQIPRFSFGDVASTQPGSIWGEIFSISQNIPNATLTILSGYTRDNTHSSTDWPVQLTPILAAGLFTVVDPGFYEVDLSITGIPLGSYVFAIHIEVNGANIYTKGSNGTANAMMFDPNVSKRVFLNSGDTLRFTIIQASGAAVNITGTLLFNRRLA